MEELANVHGVRVDHLVDTAIFGGTFGPSRGGSSMQYCVWGLQYGQTPDGKLNTSHGLKRGAALLYAWKVNDLGKYELCNASGQVVLVLEPCADFGKSNKKYEYGVFDVHGQCLGRVKQSRASFASTKIKMISGSHKKPIMWIKGPKFPQFATEFKVKRRKPKMSGIAQFRRNWKGWADDPAMALDKYDITFPPITPGVDSALSRVLLVCSAILLDRIWNDTIAEYVRKYGTESTSTDRRSWCMEDSPGWLALLLVLPLVILTFPFGLVLLLIPIPFFAATFVQEKRQRR